MVVKLNASPLILSHESESSQRCILPSLRTPLAWKISDFLTIGGKGSFGDDEGGDAIAGAELYAAILAQNLDVIENDSRFMIGINRTAVDGKIVFGEHFVSLVS